MFKLIASKMKIHYSEENMKDRSKAEIDTNNNEGQYID
jgi:hypothetical protein